MLRFKDIDWAYLRTEFNMASCIWDLHGLEEEEADQLIQLPPSHLTFSLIDAAFYCTFTQSRLSLTGALESF